MYYPLLHKPFLFSLLSKYIVNVWFYYIYFCEINDFIISEFSLDRKDIPVLIMHNLKTFHERVFESDFY